MWRMEHVCVMFNILKLISNEFNAIPLAILDHSLTLNMLVQNVLEIITYLTQQLVNENDSLTAYPATQPSV